MAVIIPFKHPAKRGSGFIIANMPMPDGTHRRYYHKNDGRNSITVVINRYKKDCEKMRGDTCATA